MQENIQMSKRIKGRFKQTSELPILEKDLPLIDIHERENELVCAVDVSIRNESNYNLLSQ